MFPIHLDLGFRRFYFYEGIYFLIAIVFAYIWAARRIKANGLSEDQFSRALSFALIGVLLFSRLFHFIFWQPGLLLTDPLVFFRFWDGGISITGGLAGGIAGGALAFIKRKERFGDYFAVLSPAILLGQALGRLGCFLNGDAWGIPTSLPWGMRFPKYGIVLPGFFVDRTMPGFAWSWSFDRGFVTAGDLSTPPLHPTQLYEFLGDLALLGIVLVLFRRLGRSKGRYILLAHVGGYCLLRFSLEFLHGDRAATILSGMTALQIALGGIVLSCAALAFRRKGS